MHKNYTLKIVNLSIENTTDNMDGSGNFPPLSYRTERTHLFLGSFPQLKLPYTDTNTQSQGFVSCCDGDVTPSDGAYMNYEALKIFNQYTSSFEGVNIETIANAAGKYYVRCQIDTNAFKPDWFNYYAVIVEINK